MKEVIVREQKGSGPGGQHRNKVNSCVIVQHIPTGITVKADMRSQSRSKSIALSLLAQKIVQIQQNQINTERNGSRKNQVGLGMRGDKIRTYRTQENRIVDHRSGKVWDLKEWTQGNW